MADFALWATAAERALRWEPGAFIAAYRENQANAVEAAAELDPVAHAVRALARARRRWEGTATELLRALAPFAPDALRASRAWPSDARGLSVCLRRTAPGLRSLGVEVELDLRAPDKDRARLISITGSPAGTPADVAGSPRAPEAAVLDFPSGARQADAWEEGVA